MTAGIVEPEVALERMTEPGSFAVPGFAARHYFIAVVFALLAAAVTWWPAVRYAPADAAPGIVAIAAVLGFIGFIDARTKLIPDAYTISAFTIVLAFVIRVQVTRGLGQPVFVSAAGTAAGAFFVMMLLVFITGFASGGDIKFAPAPAAMLAVIAPLTAVIWLGLAFLLSLFALAIRLKIRPDDKSGFPMAPMMAAALPIALAAGHYVFALAVR